MSEFIEEGGACPTGCGGKLHLPPPENCSCHIAPPCSACTDRNLTCDSCGWEAPPPEPFWPDTTVPKSQPNPWWEMVSAKPSHDLGNGKRVFDYDYDSRSGSTMVYRGRYEGPVTPDDIIALLGDGTFGHRGPTLFPDGTFLYTKITD